MTDESNAPEYVDTKFKVEATDGAETLRESETARLTIEGQTVVIMALAEIALSAMQMLFGAEVGDVLDGEGNPLTTSTIDILDTGDTAVA